ncbi:MAG: ankyrin repeat domain-containing protein [Deltaproteobacteria bacterium]|nr:ankyrin repeat domain-containing protein [Deltaproteobacteria bacterium]
MIEMTKSLGHRERRRLPSMLRGFALLLMLLAGVATLNGCGGKEEKTDPEQIPNVEDWRSKPPPPRREPRPPPEKATSPLQDAVKAGQADEVERLIRGGMDPDGHSPINGRTALFVAALEGNREIFDLLLTLGADPLAPGDRLGNTVLHAAAEAGQVEMAELLLDASIDVNHLNQFEYSPLLAAAHTGNPKMAELLVARGARIDFETMNGLTAVFIAARARHGEFAVVLVKNGADAERQFGKKGTPLMAAQMRGFDDVVALLREAGVTR